MDFFYHRRALDTHITLNELEHDNHAFQDKVLVGKDVLVFLNINKSESDRFALSICLRTRPSSGSFKHLDSLICWATLDDNAVRIGRLDIILR